MKRLLPLLALFAVAGMHRAVAQCNCPPVNQRPTVVVTDNSGAGVGTTTWTCANTYLLDGYVFVNSGQALTIQPGTVVKGMAGNGSDASALIVARGGQIYAAGTEDCPIVFTHEADPLDGSVAYNLSNQWGGLIILGAASTNLSTPNGQVEGIPSDNNRAQYGGTNDASNSGILRYVSIRHGGTTLAANNEINGLTLAGVGSGTTIDHIEVIANEDDGIEFFGGTVSVNYAAVAWAGDDSFDWDQGWRGSGHHWFSIHSVAGGTADKGLEGDGDDYPNSTANQQPYTTPTVSNWTMIGNTATTANGMIGMLFRANSGGNISNALIVNFGEAIEIEDKATNGQDAYDMRVAGNLNLSNIRAQGATDVIDYDGTAVAGADGILDTYAANNNIALGNVGIDADWAANAAGTTFTNPFNPVPTADVTSTGAFPFMGAFDPNGINWLAGWSFLDESGAANIPLSDGSTTSCDCPDLSQRPTVLVTDNAGSGVGTTTWTCDNTYVIDGFVFVNSGQTLTIEPGTVVKGAAGNGSDASALIVARGGKIYAEGTADCPIVFTHEADPLDGSVAYNLSNQWGGLIILGAASTNLSTPNGQVEGIPSDNNRAQYGGTNDADNSGILRYVSIRHGGTTLAANNEINGLTLAGVGSGTTIDHIEVIANEDDGVEFFGGTVSVNYAAVAWAGDDSFDWDQGWRGSGHHWFSIHSVAGGTADKGLEGDGDDYPNTSANQQPYTTPTISNWTMIGNTATTANGVIGMLFRANSGGNVSNAIIVNFGEAIEIEDKATNGQDAYDMYVSGNLSLSNIRAQGATDVIDYDGTAVAGADGILDTYAANNNIALGSVGIDADWAANAAGTAFTNTFNPVPTADVTASGTYGYMGAFDPSGTNWLAGWSFLDQSGAADIPLADPNGGGETATCDCPALGDRPTVLVTDNGGAGIGTTTWSCDNTYVIDGFVFVNSGQVLTIEPGTVVKGAPGNGSDASALIVARGGKIFADGTAACPIVFTHEADPLDGSVAYNLSNQWGGLIILGAASTNLSTPNGQVEGIPSDNNRAQYGGTNDADNSGILRYVSIRHGGTTLAANNEINGLTLAGVGSGTTIDHIEVIANEDDGVEFFGGTVSVSYAAVAWAGDDSFDWDQGWRGSGHHWFSIHSVAGGTADKGLEGDGDDYPNTSANQQPYTTPTVSNWTMIGNTATTANGMIGMLFRANSGGNISNALIVNFGEAIEIEDKATNGQDAYDMWVAGNLALSNVRAQGSTDVIDYDGTAVAGADGILDTYAANNNIALGSVGIDADWAANAAGTAFTNTFNPVPTADVTTTGAFPYMGAFDPSGTNWLADWSFLDQSGAANIPLSTGGTDVPGCTNATACNYNTAATVNDGSCVFATGCDTCSGATNGTGTVIDGDADNDGVCNNAEILGCTISTACNYNSAATEANNSTCIYATGCDFCAAGAVVDGDTDNDGVCNVNEIAGCTDATAANYNPLATDSNASCQFNVKVRVDMWNAGTAAKISGDFTAGAIVNMVWANYELYTFSATLTPGTYTYQFRNAAGVSDGIVRTLVVDGAEDVAAVCFGSTEGCAGCTNSEYADFNPNATSATACTEAAVAGCTYADAENFNAAANVEDGSCTFELGNACPADLSGDGVVGTPDLLIFLAAFGSNCN